MNKTAKRKIKIISGEYEKVRELYGDCSNENIAHYAKEHPESPLHTVFNRTANKEA